VTSAQAAAAVVNTVSAVHPTTGQVENTGRWTAEEHRLFLQGLEAHGKGWKKIATLIKSRTVVQIRTHAQKYFQKLGKALHNMEVATGVYRQPYGG
jgi:SHAQKYF class myb-like DNA-binding protein